MDISSNILNAKILVVDDQEANVKLLEYMLTASGYTSVTTETDSRQVVELYRNNRYDVILLDLNMPHVTGFEVMEALKEIETDGYIPVMVLTAESDHKLRALQAGAKDFVSKPFDQTEVLTRIHSMLEIRLLHKDLRDYNETLELRVKERTAALRVALERVGYLSNFDNLTGLPNRILLRDRIKRAQDKVAGSKNIMGLLVIDIARLPFIRGSLGIKHEQNLLVEMARRLKEWARLEDSVARFDDESFAIVMIRQEPKELSGAARQILQLLDRPYVFDGQELRGEPYVGIATYPDDGDDFDFLVQAAEASARRAATSKNDRYQFYTPELNRNANERLKLENSLRWALERGEFLLHYQPQLELSTGTVIGLEALIRWQHPDLGLIAPARFIGLAEETGLILPIGDWVLHEACRQNKAWQDAGLPHIPIAVNLSAKQFAGNIRRKVQEVLTETNLEAKYLELELTESLSMEDPENTVDILRSLKNMGVCLSIDDFGTGYSNLTYLKRFPVDKLKLDQSFVRDLISDPDDLSISRAVIAMAHSLRLKVIAEGVETEGQLTLLAQNGCDEIQGYFFSRPIDADACETLLREGKSLAINKSKTVAYERTLLCIDDEASIGASIKRLLKDQGYRFLFTTTAAEAFEMLATCQVGVILCDQRMPGMRGTDFLARIKQMYPDIVRMILGSHTDLKLVAEAINRGTVFKFLTKPWSDDMLLKAIGEAFDAFDANNGLKTTAVAASQID